MSNLKSINPDQRLYVMPCGKGYLCLGFDVAERKRRSILEWLGLAVEPVELGTVEAFEAYERAMHLGAVQATTTGKRCEADLTPALKGLEGLRVEVTEPNGEKRRFWVGKSTGWLPIHLEIATRRSTGGRGAYLSERAAIRVVDMGR